MVPSLPESSLVGSPVSSCWKEANILGSRPGTARRRLPRSRAERQARRAAGTARGGGNAWGASGVP